MTAKVAIPLLRTGVPGLDDLLGGGLPELSFNLISGPPGCGKTTLAHQMMFSMATPERPAIYFTVLGELPLKMLRYQQQFEYFDAAKVNHAIRFVSLAEDALTGDLERVLAHMAAEVQAHSPAFVFVDSFRSIVLASAEEGNAHNRMQRFLQRLGLLMASWAATTFLLGEYLGGPEANPVFTVSDGLIFLHQSVQRNSMVRKLEVCKMRGRPTEPGLHSFHIGSGGLEVFGPVRPPVPLSAEEARMPALPRLLIGIPQLDAMLGGGLRQGHSVLVAGPSGAGKSLLAEAFLAEGVRAGETGVLAIFEQRPSRARNPRMFDLIESGRVGLVDSRAPDLSIDELVVRLHREVQRLDARRVVIDSLSGFELSLAPTFRDDFRQSLARLVRVLSGIGVTVLMTSELEDRYSDLRFSPHGTAFLTDVIIVQRYIELESRLRRVLAVVKVRTSAHSNELREYTIDQNGLQIGAALPEQEGLLGGRPTRRRAVEAAPARRPRSPGRR